MSKTLSCEINPFWKQQTLIDNYTGKEYLVTTKEIPDTLYFLFSKGDIEKVQLTGAYFDCFDIVYKFENRFPKCKLEFEVL